MTKLIAYAYPTSASAERFGKPKGCYYVQLFTGLKEIVGSTAYDTIKQAEAQAEQMTIEWDPGYMRFPLNGSRFVGGY